MELIDLDPTADPRWPLLLDAYPESGLFHSPPWLRAIVGTYDFQIRARVIGDAAGAPRGGMVFAEVTDALGPRTISLPFSDTCNPLISSVEQWNCLFGSVARRGIPAYFRCLNERVASLDPRLEVTKRARWHRISLEPDQETLWANLHSVARNSVRKAQRAGVLVRPFASEADLEAFHALHVALRKQKYRLLAQPLEFFRAIAREFGATGGWHPLGAYLDNRLIAATIYLHWGDTLYYKFNASAADQLGARPNGLLVWAGIELARSLGCRALDLGSSDDDQPGLIRFKGHFGAQQSELRFLRYTPPGWRDGDAAEVKALLGQLTAVMTAPEIPEAISAQAGAMFYRFFA